MTEKRFKRISVCGDWGVKDIEKDKVLFFGTTDEVIDTVDLLNELDAKYVDEYALRETLQLELQRIENENEQLRKSNERIVKDIDLALGFINHKGYSLQDIKDYEDWKKELKGDVE